MFLVFNKEKIYTYIISMFTVILLFFVASNINLVSRETLETSANTDKLLPIYKVKSNKQQVALTMNCAW